MISAGVFSVLLFNPAYTGHLISPNAVFRRILMGIAMGTSAILIIHSPMGKRSGAHFNPAITLTYLRLRKITAEDAAFYVFFQFMEGVIGVAFLGASVG